MSSNNDPFLGYSKEVHGNQRGNAIIAILDGAERDKRFTDLENELESASTATIIDRLEKMVDAEVIDRKEYNEMPPKVEYSLTGRGRFHAKIVRELEELEKLGYEDPEAEEPRELVQQIDLEKIGHVEEDYLSRARTVIGRKWGPPIFQRLYRDGALRFGDLEEDPGIPASSLSNYLDKLEEEGLLDRNWYDESPPRVEYSLTELGLKYAEVIQNLKAAEYMSLEELEKVHGNEER